MLEMAELATHLIKACDSTTFEYSAIRVLARWLHEAIPEVRCAELSRHVAKLAESLSPTVGQGQREIWESHLVIQLRESRLSAYAQMLQTRATQSSSGF